MGYPLSEGDLKRSVEDYLQYKMNAGELYFDRLNSGEFIEVRGESRRRIKGCRKGTADFFVLKQQYFDIYDNLRWPHNLRWPRCRTIFLETKGDKGKQTDEQKAFQKLVEMQGAEYHIIRSIEDLEAVL